LTARTALGGHDMELRHCIAWTLRSVRMTNRPKCDQGKCLNALGEQITSSFGSSFIATAVTLKNGTSEVACICNPDVKL
jgi:hypothetical protein